MTTVESLTGFPELLGGRVKTLHPNIHAGILARRELEEDRAALAEHGIEPIDLVCVNLYPFEQVGGRRVASEDDAIEMIDVGGPSLLRGAAKNHESVDAGVPAGGLRARARRAAQRRGGLARDAAPAGGGRLLADRRLRRRDRVVVRRGR